MIESIDPLDGIEGDAVFEACRDYPTLHILAGDRLITRPRRESDDDRIVIAKDADDRHTVNDRGLLADGYVVVGVVVGIVRRIS